MRERIRRVLGRARYAAIGAAIGAGIGGLFGRNAASTGGAVGGLVGAVVGETRVSASDFIREVRDRREEVPVPQK
jgi:outer membrane lipoprotein SlyB